MTRGAIIINPAVREPGSFLKYMKGSERTIPIQKKVHLAQRPGAQVQDRSGSLWHVILRRGLRGSQSVKAPAVNTPAMAKSRRTAGLLRSAVRPGVWAPVEVLPRALTKGF